VTETDVSSQPKLSSGLPKTQTKRIQETKTVEKTVSSKPSSLCSKGSKSDSSKRVSSIPSSQLLFSHLLFSSFFHLLFQVGQVRTKTIHRSQMDLFEDVFSFNE
jgi:hypothetical protein